MTQNVWGIRGMKLTGEKRDTLTETCTSVNLSATHSTWVGLGSKPGLCSEPQHIFLDVSKSRAHCNVVEHGVMSVMEKDALKMYVCMMHVCIYVCTYITHSMVQIHLIPIAQQDYMVIKHCPFSRSAVPTSSLLDWINPLKPELNPICYLLALLRAHHFLHVSRIRVKSLTLRRLMSYIYGAPILGVSRSHTTMQHSR